MRHKLPVGVVSSRGITSLFRGAGLAEKAAEAIGIGAQHRPVLDQAAAGWLSSSNRSPNSSRAGSTDDGVAGCLSIRWHSSFLMWSASGPDASRNASRFYLQRVAIVELPMATCHSTRVAGTPRPFFGVSDTHRLARASFTDVVAVVLLSKSSALARMNCQIFSCH